MSVNVNLNGINQVNFDLDGTTTAVIAAPGVTAITNRSNAITQLTGDVEAGPGYGSVTATVVGVNGASVPASSFYVGTNSSEQIVTATTPLLPANNLSDVSSTTTARTNLGLGTMAVQNANDVAITGGAINGTTVGATTPASVSGTTLTGTNTTGTVLTLGHTTGSGTPVTNPVSINMGDSYSSTAGANPKIVLYNNAFPIGIGISSSSMDYINLSGATGKGHAFYVNGSEVVVIDPTSLGCTGTVTGKNLTIASGGGGSLTFQDGSVQSTAATGSGTVTSVGLSVPSWQTVSGSPVTSSGTLTVSDNNQSANELFAGPSSGSAAAPTFRALVPADLPLATTSAFGAVKPDGTTITISSGVISASSSGGYSLGV